jgi:hypothetical protein
MKKLIIILLFSSGLQAQSLTFVKSTQKPILVLGSNVDSGEPILVNLELKQKIEIDGHLVKFPVYFKATLDGIEIYDDNKIQYQKRKCSQDKCNIIHLEPKNTGFLTSGHWDIISTNTSKTGL